MRRAVALALVCGACAGKPAALGEATPATTERDTGADPGDEADAPDAASEPDAGDRDAATVESVAAIAGVEALVVDGTDVYALAQTEAKWRLWRVTKSGGDAVAIDDFFGGRVSFAADDARLFLATAQRVHMPRPHGVYALSAYGRVVAAPKAGGARSVLFDAPFAAGGVATWGGAVYWLSGGLGAGDDFVLDAVLTAPASHGAASSLAIGQRGATSLAVDASGIYWSLEGVADARTHAWPAGRIVRAAARRGATVSVATTSPRPRAITVDGDYVYYLAHEGALWRVDKRGGAPAQCAPRVSAYAVDGARLWSAEPGAIVARGKDLAGEPAAIPIDGAVTAIAVDDAYVYVADARGVRRFDKARAR